jgi:hypothetical protein
MLSESKGTTAVTEVGGRRGQLDCQNARPTVTPRPGPVGLLLQETQLLSIGGRRADRYSVEYVTLSGGATWVGPVRSAVEGTVESRTTQRGAEQRAAADGSGRATRPRC